MKHTKLLVCLPFCAMILAGCSGSDGPVITQDAGISYSSENVDLSKISSGSDYEVEVSKDEIPQAYDTVAKDVYFDDEMVLSAHPGIGLYEVQNEQGYVGFYSSLQNEYLITPHLIPNTYHYEVRKDVENNGINGLNFLLELHYKDAYYLYDGFGNFLGQESEGGDIPFETSVKNSAVTEPRNEQLYLTITDENDVKHYWEYDEKGLASHIDSLPPEAPEETEDVYDGPVYGDLFTVGFVVLDSYGLPGYKLVNNGHGYISVFYNDTHVTSFFIGENGVTYLGAVGKFVFFQIKTLLTKHAESYSYSEGDNKYSLETWKVSVENGEKEKLDISAVFTDIKPFHDKEDKKNVTCFVATYCKIDPEFKTLGQVTQSVVDHDFVFHNNVSGINFNMKKLSDERFLDANGVLYDKSLKVVDYLTYLNGRAVFPNQKVIEGYIKRTIDDVEKNCYGLVDYDGKVVVEFKYKTIYTSYGESGCYICVTHDNVVYRVSAESAYAEEKLGTDLQKYVNENSTYAKNFFRVTTEDNEYLYFTTTKNIVAIDSELNPGFSHRKALNEEDIYFIYYNVMDEEEPANVVGYKIFSIKGDKFEVQPIPESSKGSPREDTLFDGKYRDTAYRLSFGENLIDARSDNALNNSWVNARTWVRFDPTEDMVGKRVGIFYHNDQTPADPVPLNETSIYSYYKVDRNGIEEVYTDMLLEAEIAYDINMAGENEVEDIRYTHFRYFVVEEAASYVFQVQVTHQLNYIAFDYVDGINTELQIEAGMPGFGELNKVKFTAPTLFSLDTLYFNVNSFTDLVHTFKVSGHTVSSIGKRVGDEYNMFAGDELKLEKYVPAMDCSLDVAVELSEKTVKGEDLVLEILEPTVTKNTTVGTAKALTFGENEDIDYNEGRSFVKYTSAVSGRYGFNFLGATTGGQFLLSFDKDGNPVDSSYSSYVYVEAGGYVICSYDHTGDAIQAKEMSLHKPIAQWKLSMIQPMLSVQKFHLTLMPAASVHLSSMLLKMVPSPSLQQIQIMLLSTVSVQKAIGKHLLKDSATHYQLTANKTQSLLTSMSLSKLLTWKMLQW